MMNALRAKNAEPGTSFTRSRVMSANENRTEIRGGERSLHD